ncbi:hypothetical protein Y1Q_0013234 [Alligator mississippiensis]|uniref:Uncharacterized protein n=1 Tax=Alligator mississippiensis TaxID=8496 RepID=A0A151NV13_ALLMI|nr:hypothetical protein Y1Q_0013234 [Alligator mississippiensis]
MQGMHHWVNPYSPLCQCNVTSQHAGSLLSHSWLATSRIHSSVSAQRFFTMALFSLHFQSSVVSCRLCFSPYSGSTSKED